MTSEPTTTPEAESQRDTSIPTEGEKRACAGTSRKTGERCKAYAVRGEQYCAGHLGLGGIDPYRGGQASAEARSDRARARKMGTMDALRVLMEGDLAVAAYRAALESDDPAVKLRAAESLLSRILGKPKETVQTVESPADLENIRSMSAAERDQLYRELMAAEMADVDQGVTAA